MPLAISDRLAAENARIMLAHIARDGAVPAGYPHPVQLVRLGGELTLVALGGEAVVDCSLRLKPQLGGPGSAWIATHANDGSADCALCGLAQKARLVVTESLRGALNHWA